MPDPRLVKLAKVLVNYSIPVRAGDWFLITGNELSAPLIREAYREAIRVGAHVDTRISIDGLQEIFLKEANEEQLTHVSEYDHLL